METLGWLGPAGGARQSAPSSSGVCWGWKRGHLLAQERISPAQMWGWIAPSELPRVSKGGQAQQSSWTCCGDEQQMSHTAGFPSPGSSL